MGSFPLKETIAVTIDKSHIITIGERLYTESLEFVRELVNNAYDASQAGIQLLYKDGSLRDIAEASDNFGIQAMARPVVKHYLAFPRWLGAEWFG